MVAGLSAARTQPAPEEDCIHYDPSSLTAEDRSLQGWIVVDGRGRQFVMLDNRNDAEAAIRVMKKFTAQCFIGRRNPRPNRKEYIFRYWK
jgi:hypothetical protein